MQAIVNFILFSLILLSCQEPVGRSATFNSCCGDTVRRTVIKKFPDGGELKEQQVITFTQNGLSVPEDGLYYDAEGSYPEGGQGYRIYFNRSSVVAYCDSMLKELGPKNLDNFNDIATYRSILNHANKGSAERFYYDETHHLLNRFIPFIIHPHSGHRPPYFFTIHNRSSRREDITRNFVSQKGDTLQVSWQVVWVAPLQELEE